MTTDETKVIAALMREAARAPGVESVLYVGRRGTIDVGRDIARKATARTIEALRQLGEWKGDHPKAKRCKKARRS